MLKIYYFAYGSNLHPLRLQERVPSASVVGVVEAKSRKLTFSKRSKDYSGKCSFYQTERPEDVVFGVLYELDAKDKSRLDKAEGKGFGYKEQIVSFELNQVSYSPFTYVADNAYIDSSLKPYEWYKQFVIVGAKFHSLPEAYISWLETIETILDPDAKRRADNMDKLDAMKKYNKRVN